MQGPAGAERAVPGQHHANDWICQQGGVDMVSFSH